MNHNLYIVLLSIFVCFIFALVSFEWIHRKNEQQTTPQRFLVLGSITMAIAVWALHYMGMLSIQSPVAFIYDVTTMSVALVIGFIFSYSTFILFSAYHLQQKKTWAVTLCFGSGLIFVHIIGLLSMHNHPTGNLNIVYILLAMATTYLFTWLAVKVLYTDSLIFKKSLASLNITIGVTLLHYIGEVALIGVNPSFNWHNSFPITNINILATLLVLGATIVVLILYLLEVLDQKKITQQRIELLESQHRYNSLFELNPEGVFVVGPDHHFIKVNPSLESITGYTFKELQEMPYTELLKEDEKNGSLEYLKRVLHGETVKHPLTIFHKDGHEVELEIISIPYYIHNAIIGVIGIAKDMTAINEAQDFKQKAQTLAYVGELAAGLAHEIRNPLTSIRGFSQLFKSQYESDENEQFVDIMLRESERINFIISQLMILARPHMIIKQKNDLNELLKRSLKFLDHTSDIQDIHFKINKPDKPVYFICEENLFTQLFLNLIKNAVEAMPEGGIITVDIQQDTELINILIHDEGPGIPECIMPMIGQPFYTTKEGNPGLGLLICHHIVQHHGGKMDIESKEGCGTTVSLSLPMNVIENAEDLQKALPI
jgi:two-component system, sporulation sensor kinase E